MYIIYCKIFGGIPKMLFLCNFLKILMVSDKLITRLLELVQLYEQTPLDKIFHFHHLPNYKLALNNV